MSGEPMTHECDEIRRLWTPPRIERYCRTDWCIHVCTADPMGESSVTTSIMGVRYCPWCGQELPTEGEEDA